MLLPWCGGLRAKMRDLHDGVLLLRKVSLVWLTRLWLFDMKILFFFFFSQNSGGALSGSGHIPSSAELGFFVRWGANDREWPCGPATSLPFCCLVSPLSSATHVVYFGVFF